MSVLSKFRDRNRKKNDRTNYTNVSAIEVLSKRRCHCKQCLANKLHNIKQKEMEFDERLKDIEDYK